MGRYSWMSGPDLWLCFDLRIEPTLWNITMIKKPFGSVPSQKATMHRLAPCVLFFLTAISPVVFGEVKLPSIFGDHMVLQQDAIVPVWGWAAAGEAVTVSIAGQRQTVTADSQGKWRIKLARSSASL